MAAEMGSKLDTIQEDGKWAQGQFFYKKQEICKYFRDLWPDGKPLVKLLRTGSTGYLYDTGTNKVFGCKDLEFNLLNNLLNMEIDEAIDKTASFYAPEEFTQAVERMQTIIDNHNILKTKRTIRFGGAHFDNLRECIQTGLGMIQLEVTERCNLRCAYCVYGAHYKEKRNHGAKDMSHTTALKAIDHLNKSSCTKESVAVTFYGGEPLLCFPLIKSCVQYARSVIKGRSLSFSITTNATLMTPSIAEFFFDEGFGVLVSLDGPQDIHDAYRKNIHGEGTFERTISGLKMLYDAFGEERDRISISMVYAPPYSKEKIDRIAALWDIYPWLSGKRPPTVSYPLGFPAPSKSDQSIGSSDFSLFDWASEYYIEAHKKGFSPHPIAVSIIEKELARLMQRKTYAAPRKIFALNGCCVPGLRKQFVCADGTIMICERVGRAPSIGNVESGIDIETVEREYVTNYVKNSHHLCSGCWAIQLCSLCYMQTFRNGQIDMENKNINCSVARMGLEKFLTLFCRMLEINGSSLDYLKEYHFY